MGKAISLGWFKKDPFFFVCFLLLIPLLFTGINNCHDWGDDFAQYLLQARLFSGQIDYFPVHGQGNYSPGVKGIIYSILLVPATFFSSSPVAIAKIYTSMFLFLSGLVAFKILRQWISGLPALLFTIFTIYNYHLLRMKNDVLPDFLFLLILLIIFYMIKSHQLKIEHTSLLLAGILCGVRSAGWVMAASLIVWMLANRKLALRKLIVLLSIPIALYFTEWIFAGQGSASWYGKIIFSGINQSSILENLLVYRESFALFFEQELPFWMNLVVQVIVFSLMLTGFLWTLYRQPGLMEIFIVGYLLLILIYPYHGEPIRFLLPVFVIGVFYLVIGVNYLAGNFLPGRQNLVLTVLGVVLVALSVKTTKKEFHQEIICETTTNDAMQLYQYLKGNVSRDETIRFQKPFALAWYTGLNCIPENAPIKAHWRVEFASSPSSGGTKVFENQQFRVMRE